jgi:hypothetical protein
MPSDREDVFFAHSYAALAENLATLSELSAAAGRPIVYSTLSAAGERWRSGQDAR